MDYVWEFDCIVDEEGWEVVVYQVLIVVCGIEFGGEIVWIVQGFWGVVVVYYCGEVYEYWGFFVFVEDFGYVQVVDIGIGDEFVMGVGVVGMYYVFGNMFVVEMLQFLQQLYVLQQY